MKKETFTYNGQISRLADARVTNKEKPEWGDIRDGRVYDVDPALRLSVEVALAARRPLLLRGEPGSGKSSLASYIARNLKARYYEHVVTSRTVAEDMLWRFDAIRKLSDAQARSAGDAALEDKNYIEPGVLWWALNRESALEQGSEPFSEINRGREANRVVVLIDELDKADPDVPNGLLVPIGSSEFRVRETGVVVRQSEDKSQQLENFLVVVTTNETRELPAAFVRRCVVHFIGHPDAEKLVKIAKAHARRWQPPPKKRDDQLFRDIADRVVTLRDEAARTRNRQPSTAEYLDAVRACRRMNISFDSDEWKRLERVILLKGKESIGGDSARQ